MSIKPDRWIREMCREHAMITPFEEKQVRQGVISYGVSSYGYDIRIADEFKIFTNVNSTIVDPKNMDPGSMVDFRGPVAVIPPNSFALGRTVEYFRIPRNVLTICVGKCLTGDTRVVDATTGDYLPLEDLVRRRSGATVSLDQWKLRAAEVGRHVVNGPQAVFRVGTRSGLEIKATASHPFRMLEGYRELRHLAPGDRIAVARSCPVFGTTDWPVHEATLLGLMLADGQCHTPRHSPRYTTADPRLAEVFRDAARSFGCEVTAVDRFGFNLVNHAGRGGIPERNRASVWLERLGCNVRSRHKFVPSVVFTARRESVRRFLQALFSGDGSAYQSASAVYLEYTSISERLIRDVRHLLLRFGVFGLVRRKVLATGGEAWRIQITDRAMIQRFAKEIGFVPGSRKQAALDRLLSAIESCPRRRSNFDTLPPRASHLMKQVVHACGRSLNSIGIRRTQLRQSLSYDVAATASLAVSDVDWTALVHSDVVWDVVTEIVPAGEDVVYDLSIPGMENFVANDMVVHNSTYARCGIITNVTPFEPEWEGFVTLEISNTTPLPAKIYANEGIAQVLFFESDEPCETSYRDKAGKYQAQQGITLPRL